MIAAAAARVPVRIYLLRGLRVETLHGWQRRILLGTEWLASRLAQHVVCNSFSLRNTFLELRLGPPSKVTVLGAGSSNGVDTIRFHPCSSTDEESARLRRALGFNADERIIGFVGRLTRDKGICDLLEAYDEVVHNLNQTRLLLVGDFETGDPLPKDVIARIVGDDRIVVTGFVDDTAPYYRLMDLLVFPSYREGFPNAPLEAAASAVPVVGYGATGTVDAVSDGETGLLVDVADSQGLAKGICRLLDDALLAEKMGVAARQRAVTVYDSRKVWQYWVDLYRKRIAERVPPFR
jgi:glycosyltransferase involved in cell wall biosynthesis